MTVTPEKFEPFFTAFMQRAQAVATADFLKFMPGQEARAPKLTYTRGPKYIRIVSGTGDQRSAWAFVDTTTGNVLKTDGWKRPAKGIRGNIFDAQNGTGRVRWTGVQ